MVKMTHADCFGSVTGTPADNVSGCYITNNTNKTIQNTKCDYTCGEDAAGYKLKAGLRVLCRSVGTTSNNVSIWFFR